MLSIVPLGTCKLVQDELGVWTGARQFGVRLQPDPARPNDLTSPPPYFNVDGFLGYIFYPFLMSLGKVGR
ncbi:hypothetical protein GN956_G3122 [Arapaima gigas]